jgi:hypothetical protein
VILKALIVDEPWMSHILKGDKTWEMRKTQCKIRGPVALIRKGSGQVVGIAEVIGSLPPITSLAEFAAAEPKHRIPPVRQPRSFADGWRNPWVLAKARPLARPVPYRHPSGAVIWVNLEPRVVEQIEAQL